MIGTSTEAYPWKPIPSFRPPDWTHNRFLAQHINNGVIEAMPVNSIVGVKISNIVLVCTRAWFGHRRWGVAYSPIGEMVPLPYWSKRLTPEWSAWYMKGDTTNQLSPVGSKCTTYGRFKVYHPAGLVFGYHNRVSLAMRSYP